MVPSLGVNRGQHVDLLSKPCHEVKTNISPPAPGAATYIQQDNRFAEEGIMLQYHQYTPVPYRQRYVPFIPHLSVIDLLCNEGPRSLEIIRAGRGVYVEN